MTLFSGPKTDDRLFDQVIPERPPTFREAQNERVEEEPLDDYDAREDAPSFAPHRPTAEELENDEPLPVYVVGASPSEDRVRDWQSASYVIGPASAPVQILGRNRNRIRAVVAVRGFAVEDFHVTLLRRPTDGAGRGAVLNVLTAVAGGFQQIELLHNDEVWAVATDPASVNDPAAQMAIDVVSEFWVEESLEGA